MHVTLVPCLIVWFLAVLTAASGPTKVYIDSVPEYDLLQSCAEHQVSLIVRNMEYGCGDDSKLTSYACFCIQSSAYYSRMISTKVTSACSKTRGQENSALEVFSKYCQLADLEKVTTTADSETLEPTSSAPSMQSTSASPASTPSTMTASSTASPTGSSTSQTGEPPDPERQDNTAAIAAGVVVPVVVIALGLVGFLLYLHRRKRNPHSPSELSASAENQATEVSGAPMAYGKETYRHVELDAERPQELATDHGRGELGASTPEVDRDRKIQRLLIIENNM